LQIEPIAYKDFWNKLTPTTWKFIFPYDWRLPNEINADKLNIFINFIIEKSKVLKKNNVDKIEEITHIDIVTHSMGNFPARFYVKKYGFDKINKIIFVAPPFLGAADTISALTVGQGLFFNHEEIRKMARTFPALFEFLPRYNHASVEKKSNQPLNIFDIDNWQKNLVTKGRGKKDVSIEKFITNLKSVNERLNTVDNWLDTISEKDKNKILVLVKTEFKTFTSLLIEKNPEDNQPENFFNLRDSLYVEEGDGVVPNASSCVYHKQIATYAIFNEFFKDDKKHAFLMRDSRIQRIINDFLNSSDDTTQFKPELIGRSVKKVQKLQSVNVKDNNVNFTYKKIICT